MTDQLRIIGPDGRPFEFYLKLVEQRDKSDQRAEEERERAEEERERANTAVLQVEAANRHAELDRLRGDEAVLKAERLLAQPRALGMEPEA